VYEREYKIEAGVTIEHKATTILVKRESTNLTMAVGESVMWMIQDQVMRGTTKEVKGGSVWVNKSQVSPVRLSAVRARSKQ
jgi:hypothetical protein